MKAFILEFRQSFGFVWPEANFDTSVDETGGSEDSFRYPDFPLDRLGRFQIYRAGHAMGFDSRQRVRSFGVRALVLRA